MEESRFILCDGTCNNSDSLTAAEPEIEPGFPLLWNMLAICDTFEPITRVVAEPPVSLVTTDDFLSSIVIKIPATNKYIRSVIIMRLRMSYLIEITY